MTAYKISVLQRALDVVWNFKKTNDKDFWEALAERLKKEFAPSPMVDNSQGSFFHCFYFYSDKDVDTLQKTVRGILAEFLSEKDLETVVVALSTLKENEASVLPPYPASAASEEPKEKNELSGSLIDALRKKIASDPPKKIAEEAPEQPAKKEAPQKEEPKKANTPASNMGESLLEKAQKLDELKKLLLEEVKGQRHAVDKVVQSIFESEMFALNNPKRSGPLATFLFTGPSGVGKTMLAKLCGKELGRKFLAVDMSEYSDNLANNKFNGEHGQAAVVTGFVRENPNGIILFDEVEKAHINTIHLFLQILDEARLMDHQIKKEVSFRDTIVIMTTNAGSSLYADSSVCDLSATPTGVILDALRSDINPQTREPFFPECITTRMASGNVILFNHLEPFSLMQIVEKEIAEQVALFEKSSGIRVQYDPRQFAALALYHGGGVSDARSLRGLARRILVGELQEIVMQLYRSSKDKVNALKNVTVTMEPPTDEEVKKLFEDPEPMRAAAFTEALSAPLSFPFATVENLCDAEAMKRKARGVMDFILIDPLCGCVQKERIPKDVEDVDSDGMRLFRYLRENEPELPLYVLDTTGSHNFETLLAQGAKGIVPWKDENPAALESELEEISFGARINNSVYSLGRSGKFLSFNCAQYEVGESDAVICFEKLTLKRAYRSADSALIAKKGKNNNLMLADVVGCKGAKETLAEYSKILDNPRKEMATGKRIPKGVLLYGPPGTGKTLLAKAMANQCNATFIPVSATTFFGSLVGQTEKNIRDVFAKARKYAPSIIFVDEVDAIGRMRSGSVGSTHNEDALTTFLAQMDGFATDEKRPVFVLAATNYEISGDSGRVLDPAFVRRFDDKLYIALPDTDDRYEYLRRFMLKHSVSFGEDHEKVLRNMAERTGGMSLADLEIMNNSFIRGLGEDAPDAAKYFDALDSFRFGEVNKMDPEHLRQTACHEAGHALICRLCGTTPSFLTVVSRGNYGGFMESAPKQGTYTFEDMMNVVCRCLAGRAAELEVYGETLGLNTGASSDIRKARYYVRSSLEDYAMGSHLFIKDKEEEEAEKLMREQFDRARRLMQEHRGTLDRLTDLLAEKKSLDQNQMEEFFTQEKL